MIDGLGLFLERAPQPRWYTFKVTEAGVSMCPHNEIPKRPTERGSLQVDEQGEGTFIHIKGLNAYNALERAQRIYREQTNERQHQQTTPSK